MPAADPQHAIHAGDRPMPWLQAGPISPRLGVLLTARLGENTHGMVERLLDEFGIQENPFDEVHWREAVNAFRRYGKGRQPARLNFGD
jgi:ribonuclease VapC